MSNKMLTDDEVDGKIAGLYNYGAVSTRHVLECERTAYRAGAAAERARLLPVLVELVACKDAAGPSNKADDEEGYRWTDAWAALRKAIEP